MDLVPDDAETFIHSLDEDRQIWPDGLIGHLHKTMMRGGPFVYIVEMPNLPCTWSLTFRDENIISSTGTDITIHKCVYGSPDRRGVRSAIITPILDRDLVRIEVILEKMERGRELYVHVRNRFPGKTCKVTTYSLKTAKVV